jgi:HEAT repeat protein
VIEAIGAMDGDEAVDLLLGHIGDHDSHVRRIAVEALARQRVARAFDPLMERLDAEPYQDVTEEIVRALLCVAPERIEERLGEFPVRVREDIGRFSEDVETLLRLSRDEDSRVRLSGLYGLGRMGGERAGARLVEVLGDPDPEVRRTAVIALGPALVDFPAVDTVLRDGDMWVRLHGVRALGESCTEGALDKIEPLLKDEETPVLMAAVEALSCIGGPRAKALLGVLAGHRDDGVREAALHARERL